MDDPLFEGGQGRSPESVESDGRVCGWLFCAVVGFLLVVVFMLSGCASRMNPESEMVRIKR